MNQQMAPGEVLILLAATTLIQLLFSLYLPEALFIDFPLIVTLYVGWSTTPVTGAFWGSVLGLMRDITGLLPYWGLNGFSKTLLGFLAAFLSRWVVLESLPARTLLIAVIALVDRSLVTWLLSLVGHPVPANVLQLLATQAVLTGLAGGIFFRVYDRYKFPEKDFTQVK